MGSNNFTYQMTLLDCCLFKQYYLVAEFAKDVSLVKAVNVSGDVVGFGQVEVDVLLGHASIIHFYIHKIN